MNESATCPPEIEAASEHEVGFGRRLLIYCSVWLLASVAFEVFLRPQGLTETAASPLEQRLWWPIDTPLMAMLGLAQAATWPHDNFADWAVTASLICFVGHAVFALTARNRLRVIVLTGFHVILAAAGVVFFVLQSRLPTGG